MQSRGRGWCFTINNPSEEPISFTGATYYVYQLEKGESGTPHIQGYVYYAKTRRFGAVRAEMPAGCHVELARGSPASNRAYCTKDDGRLSEPVEWGTIPSPGSRTDLAAVQVSIDAGATVDEVRCEHYLTYIKYQRALDTDIARRFGARDPNNPVTVICYTGCTGSGKSRAAYADFPGAYWKPNGKWWPGYAGQ
ncbi:replication protein, partial [uncultured marine virus]